nr:DNA-binding protein [uncultured Flavonifractor sp.]
MKESVYKNHNEAKVLGVSPSNGYELMHEPDFPVLRVGNRMVVPKEKLIQWVEEYTGGAI